MYPSFLIMIESSTPKYLKDCKTAYELNSFADFLELGFIHRTKWQSHEYSSSINVFIEFKNLLPKNFLAAFLAVFWLVSLCWFAYYPIHILEI